MNTLDSIRTYGQPTTVTLYKSTASRRIKIDQSGQRWMVTLSQFDLSYGSLDPIRTWNHIEIRRTEAEARAYANRAYRALAEQGWRKA